MGGSAKPVGGYDKKTLAADVRALLAHLGIGRAHLVGHDIGAMVAYAHAANHPGATDRIALVPFSPRRPTEPAPPWTATPNRTMPTRRARAGCVRATSRRTARRSPDRTEAWRPVTEWIRCRAPDAVVRTDGVRHSCRPAPELDDIVGGAWALSRWLTASAYVRGSRLLPQASGPAARQRLLSRDAGAFGRVPEC
ncbi:alpha/beta fold hydrolase [Streptomyces sp. NPDC023588]|uniref:alpha/beta fold hydrolase n=1 Tax=Streptomyces sp. NPDC023588 TaxID=3154907 RepID=UPI0033DC691F